MVATVSVLNKPLLSPQPPLQGVVLEICGGEVASRAEHSSLRGRGRGWEEGEWFLAFIALADSQHPVVAHSHLRL